MLQKVPMEAPDGRDPPRNAEGQVLSYTSISKQQVRPAAGGCVALGCCAAALIWVAAHNPASLPAPTGNQPAPPLSFPHPTPTPTPQAKEIFIRTLPVSDPVLRHHLAALAPTAYKYAALRQAERQQVRDTNRVRSAPHETHIKITQVGGGSACGRWCVAGALGGSVGRFLTHPSLQPC